MISKSTTIPGHVEDLTECFDNLRKNQLKLNPEKYTFGVGAGKFLGFMISNRGIEANPEKIKAIQEMKAPKTQKDMQKLVGSLAALRRFVSKLAERCLAFFDLLKGATNKKAVNWSPECQKAFEEIKSYLSQPPVLTKAQPGEPLYLYLSAGAQAVGASLIREENGKQQPVYYVSQVLKDAEKRYPRLEKFAFALVTTSRKLRNYFQGREIKVVRNQPLRKIIHKPDVSGRLVNWAVELSQFNLSFIHRTAIKAQELADFIIECNFPEEEPEPTEMAQEPEKETISGAWTLKVDGSSTTERSGAGLILKSPEGFTIQTAICFGFPATNNQAKYEALITGLKLSRTLRVQDLKIYSDSQIVVKQTNGEYITKDPILAKYQALVQSYLASIPKHQVLQICREENEETDILSKLVRNSSDLDCSVYFEELHKPSIESEEVLEIESNHNWMTPFINYLEKGELPEDKGKAQRLKAKQPSSSSKKEYSIEKLLPVMQPQEGGVRGQRPPGICLDERPPLGKKSKKDQGNKKEANAAKPKRLEEMQEQIRKEEEAKLELKIQKRMQLEEEKLLAKSRTKRARRDPTPELISDDEEEEK
ncbi:uncharacterized protein LOC141690785 [Apium graveolens]|uniref:uncharacterized protein LOC141690785 n=1 Tax=Apium graveolens TaxID=4045 RepID=UPI003D7B40AE